MASVIILDPEDDKLGGEKDYPDDLTLRDLKQLFPDSDIFIIPNDRDITVKKTGT